MLESRANSAKPWRLARSVFLSASLALPLFGCASAKAPVKALSASSSAVASGPSSPAGELRQARVFVLPESSPANLVSPDADGTRRLVLRGMRLVDHPDGALERARELLPATRATKVASLPDRFGGGFLFLVDTVNGTNAWRAETWLGKLEPLAHFGFEVERAVVGFDRVYLFDRRGGEPMALDPASGRALDSGALPSSPSYGTMAFANGWLGAVDVPFRGTLVSFDAGASWNPLELRGVNSVAVDGEDLVINATSGTFTLDDSGVLRPRARQGSSADSVFEDMTRRPSAKAAPANPLEAVIKRSAIGVLGRRPLREALLHGIADAATTALVAENGALARVRLRDGKLLEARTHAYPGTGACQGIPLESGLGFVCGEERGGTVIYRVSAELALEPVLRFGNARFVAASGNGALVVRGSCAETAAPAAGSYCIRSKLGNLREVRVRGDVGVERVVALADGRVAVLVPPRSGMQGSLSLVRADGSSEALPLKLPKAERAKTAFLQKALWLDGFVEVRPGELSGWVVGAGPFAGVRVAVDGHVELGSVERDVDRALLAGRHALLFGSAGVASETTDNGFSWRDVQLPLELPEDGLRVPEGAEEQGCSMLGCAFGSFLRVGWAGKGSNDESLAARVPSDVARISPGGGRWTLHCNAGREANARTRAAPVPAADRDGDSGTGGLGLSSLSARRASAKLTPTWSNFMDRPPPARRPDDQGFEAGTDEKAVQLRGYIWGTRGANWDRVAKWQLYVADRMALSGSWTTLVSKSPWPDFAVASQAFGADTNGSANWEASLDPMGRAGALVVTARGTVELFLFEEERGITAVKDAARLGYFTLAGVVKLGDEWFIGIEAGSQDFRILKIEGNRLRVLGEYPVHRLSRTVVRASLVRSSRGNSLGIWARSAGYHLFPVDRENGSVRAPLELTAATLARTPEACTATDEGWLLRTSPSDAGRDLLEPNLDLGTTRVHNVEVRMIASALGVCIDAISAQTESAAASGSSLVSASKMPVALALSEGRFGGRRRAFRCTP